MNEFWFVPKRYGYGATPVTWEGWVAVAILVTITIGFAVIYQRRKKAGLNNRTPWLALIGSIAVFVWICAVKTNGDWGWRWGQLGPQVSLEGQVG
jgi:hypothetical protein